MPPWQSRDFYDQGSQVPRNTSYPYQPGENVPADSVYYGGQYWSPHSEAGRDYRELQGLQWDPNTFMPTNLGHAPTRQQSAEIDWMSQQLYQQAKARYFQDALGSNAQALRQLGQYRPGGAAGVAANILQNRSSLQFGIGRSLERPDVFAKKRESDRAQLAKEAKQAGQMALLGSALGAGAQILGASMGGGSGAAAGAAGGSYLGSSLAPPPAVAPQGPAGPSGPGMGSARGGGAGYPPAGMGVPGGAAGAGEGAGVQSPAGMRGEGDAHGFVGQQGAGQVSGYAPLQAAMLSLKSRKLDHDFMARASANVDYMMSRTPGIRRPPYLYDRMSA